jgi:hypothetical protein
MHAVAHVLYENGLHVSLAFGTEMAQKASDDPGIYGHKRVFVAGTKGFVHWRFNSWERTTLEGGYESGPLNYGEQDVVAQGNFTEAVFDWLDDENTVHPTHLKQSLPGIYSHKRVFVVGTKGFVHWRFSSWERATLEDGYEGGPLNYGEQDVVAQGNFTEAVFDWLDDENNVHPTHLKQSLAESNLILGMYYSGITNEIIELPFEPPDGLMDMLREKL